MANCGEALWNDDKQNKAFYNFAFINAVCLKKYNTQLEMISLQLVEEVAEDRSRIKKNNLNAIGGEFEGKKIWKVLNIY